MNMMVVQVIKIAHAMMVVQVMKIAYALIVVQVIKIVHAIIVVQVIRIVYALIVMQVMKGEKIMKPGSELKDPFRDENSQILYCLQSSLINTSLLGHTKAASLLFPLHQVPISSPDHASFYKLRGEPANKDPYQVGGIRLQFPELQAEE